MNELIQALAVLLILSGVVLMFIVARLYDRFNEAQKAEQLEKLEAHLKKTRAVTRFGYLERERSKEDPTYPFKK
jgi:positive regulator of sigma E activity